jgi:hypothetical protein
MNAHRLTSPQVPADALESPRKGHGAKSDAVREQAILALLSERTIGQAAARCGVNERTLRRWLKTPRLALTTTRRASRRSTPACMAALESK